MKEAVPTVSLVGYTNAGKSTLFNILADSDVSGLTSYLQHSTQPYAV